MFSLVLLAAVCLLVPLIPSSSKVEKPPALTKALAKSGAVAGAPTLSKGTYEVSRNNRSDKTNIQVNAGPLPPDTTSWSDEYRELKARSDRGDLEAASRLFRDTLRCSKYSSLQERIALTLNMYSGGTPPESVLRKYDETLSKLKDEVSSLTQLCASAPPKDVKEAIYPAVKTAATLGNPMAASCFVDGSVLFGENPPSLDTKSDYAQAALQFADQGIRSGNWAMVAILARAYENTPPEYGGRGPLGDLVSPDPLAAYSFLLLERDGISDPNAIENMDRTLESVRAANHFSKEQIAVAQDWANSTYRAYFEGHPFPSGSTVSICDLD